GWKLFKWNVGVNRRLRVQAGHRRAITFACRAMALRTIFFVNHLAAIHAGLPELRAGPGFVIREVWHPLHHQKPDDRAKLGLRRVGQKLSAMRHEILWIQSESEQPILIVSLPGRHERCALRTADELAVFFDYVTAETGVSLVRYPAERGIEFRHLRE